LATSSEQLWQLLEIRKKKAEAKKRKEVEVQPTTISQEVARAKAVKRAVETREPEAELVTTAQRAFVEAEGETLEQIASREYETYEQRGFKKRLLAEEILLKEQREQLVPTREYYTDPSMLRYTTGGIIQRQRIDPRIAQLRETRKQIQQLPPGGRFYRTPTDTYEYRIPIKPEPSKPSGPTISGFAAYISMPMEERMGYAWESLFGEHQKIVKTDKGYELKTTWVSPFETQHMKEIREYNEQIYKTLWESGDTLGILGRWIRSPLVIAPVSYGAGAGFALAFRGIGAASIGATGLTGKVLGGFAARGPWVAGTIISGTVGADIAATAAYEEKELVPSGTTIKKIMGTGVMFTSAYYGYKAGAIWKPSKPIVKKEALIKYGKTGYVEAFGGRSYIELFGKPIYFGKKWFALPKSGMVGMAPKPSMPYKPPGISKAPTIFGHPPIGKPLVPVGYGQLGTGKYTFITPSDTWQPVTKYEPSPFEISTKVWPKPKPYRSYETYFLMFYGQKPIATITKKPISMKPFHKTARDVIKSDKQIIKDAVSKEPGVKVTKFWIDKQFLQSLQKTKQITKPKVISKQITSPLSKKIVIPRELWKRLWTREPLMKPKLKSRFEGLKQIYKQKQISLQKQAQAMLYGLNIKQASMQTQAFNQVQGFTSAFAFRQRQLYGFAQTSVIASAMKFGLKQDYYQRYKFDIPSIFVGKYKVPYAIPSVTPHPIRGEPKPTPRKIKFPGLPEFEGDGGLFLPFGQAYNVYIKRRQYVQGEKKYPTSYRKAGGPHTEMDALSLMGTILDKTPRASGYIKPVEGKPTRLKRKTKNWFNLAPKFYQKSDGIYVENIMHRISSPGEIHGISRLGWTAPRKKTKKKRKRRMMF